MYCFVCRAFAYKVSGSVGQVDPAFVSSGTQASQWKDARSALSKHQASAVHKQAALCLSNYQTTTPVNLQLDKAAAENASRIKNSRKGIDRFSTVSLMLLTIGSDQSPPF